MPSLISKSTASGIRRITEVEEGVDMESRNRLSENRTRQDAYERLTRAEVGWKVKPTMKFLVALREYLYKWIEKVDEAIAKMPNCEVIVGNLGIVYDGNDAEDAQREFDEYVRMSKTGRGRAGGEGVVLLANGDVVEEHGEVERE